MGYPFSPEEPRPTGQLWPVTRLWLAVAVTAAALVALALVVLT